MFVELFFTSFSELHFNKSYPPSQQMFRHGLAGEGDKGPSLSYKTLRVDNVGITQGKLNEFATGNPLLVPVIKGKGNEVRKIIQGYMNALQVFNFSAPGFEQKC
jgi:hypothetical protein